MAKNKFLSILTSTLILPVFINNAVSGPSQRDIERNRINQIESGDFSTNIIISDEGELLLVIEDKGIRKHLTKEVLSIIKETLPELITEAVETIPQQSTDLTERLALANYYFNQKQYSLSASLYEDVITNFNLEDQGYNAVEGLATASFYGSGRHVQGLYFICQQYKFRPYWSHRFRHDIHAHLRALAVKFGYRYAETVLKNLRKRRECQREDFSKVWIPINLSNMLNLEEGDVTEDYYFYGDKADRYANRLIAEENHKFLDYVYFVNGDFQSVVDRYPKSYIYDMALLKIIKNSESYKQALPVIDLYTSRFGSSTEGFRNSIRTLYELEVNRGNEADLSRLLIDQGALLLEPSKDTIRPNTFDMTSTEILTIKSFNDFLRQKYSSLFKSLNIQSLIRILQGFDEKFSTIYGKKYKVLITDPSYRYYKFETNCNIEDPNCYSSTKLARYIKCLTEVREALEKFDEVFLFQFAQNLKRCGDVRVFLDEEKLSPLQSNLCQVISSFYRRISYHDIASSVFELLYDLDTDKNHQALFMAALCEKHNGHFDRFLTKLTRYTSDNPRKSFSDDALTEIGWYYLAIAEDLNKANSFFRKVINQYKDTNAYDNALNWLVISSRNQGNYQAAFRYGSELAYITLSSRLKKAISGRHENIRHIANRVNTEKSSISIGTTWRGVFVDFFGSDQSSAIVRSSSLDKSYKLTVGSIIISVNGEDVNSSDEFYRELISANNRGSSTVEITFIGADKWTTYSGIYPTKLFGLAR